ncbi:DUF413 domain-containing protein [Alteromonadaceae bacterium M269]|nr:DUF413 domain-containing protein [Alteromonadaceae bacterium M269]
MTIQDRNSFFTRQYSDPANYPYGFSRSGDFSISESKALSEYGLLICAMLDGSYIPETQEDKDLLASITGKKPISSVVERAWDKYQKRINRQKHISIYGSNNVANDDDADSSTVDEEIDIDV